MTPGRGPFTACHIRVQRIKLNWPGGCTLPYLLLCDAQMQLGAALGLPTFQIGEVRYYQRLTLILRGHRIEHIFYPIFPPNEHAAQVLAWLKAHP